MNTKLILEITRNKELMGLLIEQTGPAVEIADDVIKAFISKFKNVEPALISDIEIVKNLAKNRNPQKQKILINAINRLLENKKIADYLIPKLYQSLDMSVKNWIGNAKQQIKNAKKSGTDYNQVLRGINNVTSPRTISPRTNRPVVDVEIPKLREYLRQDLQNYAYEVFNPIETKYTKAIEKGMEQAKAGFKTGWKGKSAGLIASRKFLKTITPKTIEKKYPKLFRAFTDEEKQIFWKWFFLGVPDTNVLQKAWKEYGFVGAFSNFSAQLIRKAIWIMFILTILKGIRDLIVDGFTEGKEYTDTIFWESMYRAARAFEFPHWGIVSPVFWFFKILWVGYSGGGSSGSGTASKAVWDYLIGNDINKTPSPKVIRAKDFINQFINNSGKAINKKENQLKEVLSGNNIQIEELEQSDTTIPLQEPKNTEINQQPTDTTKTQTTQPPKAEQKPNIQQPKSVTGKKLKPVD